LGRIFKTPSDDAVEETLRSMHIANSVDIAYERTVGWIKVVLFSCLAAFVVSAFEFYSDWNLWEDSGNWVKNKLAEWSNAIFD
tara:strand:- start:1606 stop:1854 length:249 start_codon:yes stop_codon:yes gene_type:complete